MKSVFIFCLFISTLSHAIETSERLFECTEIFKQRKSELLVELERIDEEKQALNALKVATEELLKKKEVSLTLKEQEIEKKLNDATQKEENAKAMLEKNEAVLKEIRSIKMGKVAESFAKMKPASASKVLAEMDAEDAVTILKTLQPKNVAQILSKMDSKKASELTLLLAN